MVNERSEKLTNRSAIIKVAENDVLLRRRWNKEYRYSYALKNIKFIHIGKCGGTSIIKHFLESEINVDEYHLRKPEWNREDSYFLWVRNPIKRFVSAFNHSKSILSHNMEKSDIKNITIENCQAPQKVIQLIRTGIAFDAEYDGLVSEFNTANALAESLTGLNSRLKKRAHNLMSNQQEHIYKGIGWYLDNGQFVDRHVSQIGFVGRLEYMRNDFEMLLDHFQLKSLIDGPITHSRKGRGGFSTELSKLAVENIRKYYAKTDYKALDTLKINGFIGQDTIDEYNEYAF